MFKRSRSRAAESPARCSFCAKTTKEVDKLISGPGVSICSECIGLCDEILEEESPAEH